MPSTNSNLSAAQVAREDEFYTQLPDIERELWHYREHFRGKVIYLNCDDPRVSNFFRYFSLGFEHLGLKKLIATCYKSQDAGSFSRNDSAQGLYLEYEGDKDGNRMPDHDEITVRPLTGDGDFRSPECTELLRQADIVVTNPPFSLFREYVAQLMEYGKKFIIIGNQNAITYRDIFQLIMEGRLWVGNNSGSMTFQTPGQELRSFGNICWYTNLDFTKRHENLILYRTYNPVDYPAYDNYDAIEVGRVADIPCDYEGVMGVPVTFLDKYNPDQFEILGLSGLDYYPMTRTYGKKKRVVDGKHQISNTGTLRAVIRTESFGTGTYFDVGYPVRGVYRRLFIQRRASA
jgi:hypothetical protein